MKQDFTKNFIKGKIGEVIFDQMFRERDRYVVIPFGYENVLPEFCYYSKNHKHKDVIDNIRNAPDFAVVSKDREDIYLVEVKYRTNINIEEIIEVAKRIQDKWKKVWIFICTPNGFYLDKTTDIIKNRKINRMGNYWISEKTQEKYLKLLSDFIKTTKPMK